MRYGHRYCQLSISSAIRFPVVWEAVAVGTGRAAGAGIRNHAHRVDLQAVVVGLRSFYFDLMAVMRLQHGAVALQGNALSAATLGENPIAARLFQASANRGF